MHGVAEGSEWEANEEFLFSRAVEQDFFSWIGEEIAGGDGVSGGAQKRKGGATKEIIPQ